MLSRVYFYQNSPCKFLNISSDYYPFGMVMPNRSFSGGDYRYGFNGMEADDEIKGNRNSYITPARLYDPRVGRWLSIDPEQKNFPSQSPYTGFNNSPILFADPSGKSGIVTIDKNSKTVTVSMDVHLYGGGASPELAAQLDKDVKALLTQNVSSMMVNGDEYAIKWDVNIDFYTDDAAFENIKGALNPEEGKRYPSDDVSQNFVRVENVNEQQKKEAQFGDVSGEVSFFQNKGNNGFWVNGSYENIFKNPDVALHELLHGIGALGNHSDVYRDGAAPGVMSTPQMEASMFPNIADKYISSETNEAGNKLITGRGLPHLQEVVLPFSRNGMTPDVNTSGETVGIKNVVFGDDGTATFQLGSRSNLYYNRVGNTTNEQPAHVDPAER